MEIRKAAILGATGAAGRFLADELSARGVELRLVSRSRKHLEQRLEAVAAERVAADIRDPEATAGAAAGCDVVFDCIGVPVERMADHPLTARNVAAAVSRRGIRCVQVSSYWSYLPIERTPLTESHPRSGGNTLARLRREAEDILLEAGAAVVNLPDFYGPFVHMATLQQALQEAVTGRTVNWIGATDTPREYVYVPAAMRAVVELAMHEDAYGGRWIVPGAGPISITEVLEIVRRHLGREIEIRSAGPLTLRVASLFVKRLRSFMPMAKTYTRPISFDGAKLQGLIGDIGAVPYAEGVPRTLDWLSSRAQR